MVPPRAPSFGDRRECGSGRLHRVGGVPAWGDPWFPHAPPPSEIAVNVAVVGHVEWVEFARVDHVPEPGEIVPALETWEEPAGGGAVAAVQLANLAGSCLLFTALAGDDLGRRSREELGARGVTVHAGQAPGMQRRALTHVDENGERTITVLGDKLLPSGENGSLPWEELRRCDAVYFTGGDLAALRAARHCPVLV